MTGGRGVAETTSDATASPSRYRALGRKASAAACSDYVQGGREQGKEATA